MNTYLSQYDHELEEESIQMTEKILTYVLENKLIFQTLLKGEAAPSFEKRMMNLTRGFMLDNLTSDKVISKQESEYVSTFVISGVIHVIKDWIQNDMDQPPEEMAVMVNHFILHGLSHFE